MDRKRKLKRRDECDSKSIALGKVDCDVCLSLGCHLVGGSNVKEKTTTATRKMTEEHPKNVILSEEHLISENI